MLGNIHALATITFIIRATRYCVIFSILLADSEMTRHTENVTSIQKEILTEFKCNLKDILTPEYTDKHLIKWLRAQNFNVTKAEKLFRANFDNRIAYQLNELLDFYVKPEVAQKYEVACRLGFAKDGSVLRYIGAGRIDYYGFIMSMSCMELCHYSAYLVESDIQALKEECLKTGRVVNEITYIMDMEGFHIQQVLHKNVIEMGMDVGCLFQECYPEIWSNVLIVNAPMIFDKAFNIFKPILHSQLLDSIEMARKDTSKELLLKYIDEDILPAFLGGKRTDSNGDPYCREFISFGGKIPEKFYCCNSRILLSPTDPDVVCVTVSPRSTFNRNIIIKEGGSRIRFQHRFENGSLYISVYHKEFETDSGNSVLPAPDEYIDVNDEKSKIKQIGVTIRVQGHCCQEDGMMICKWPGIYITTFSNAGSWFTSRKLLVRLTTLPPDSQAS